MVATAAWCSRVLAMQDYDMALNVAVQAFGPRGWLLGCALAAVGAGVLVLVTTRHSVSRTAAVAPFALLTAGAVGFGVWAGDVAAWENALNWRVFDTALMLPALLGVLIVVVRPAAWSADAVRRSTTFAVVCGVIASLVLVIQSFGWRDATSDLRAELRSTPSGCVALADLASAERAPLRHWATSMLVLEVQGLHPHVLALRNRHLCERYARTGEAELWPWGDVVEDRGAGGRFLLPASG